jgi:hypothetical protein
MSTKNPNHTEIIGAICEFLNTKGLRVVSPIYPSPEGSVVIVTNENNKDVFRIRVDLVSSEIKVEDFPSTNIIIERMKGWPKE